MPPLSSPGSSLGSARPQRIKLRREKFSQPSLGQGPGTPSDDQIGEDYQQPRDDDFRYTWGNFVDVCAFYDRAAAAGRAVIFTAT